jgi:hypothetical protein
MKTPDRITHEWDTPEGPFIQIAQGSSPVVICVTDEDYNLIEKCPFIIRELEMSEISEAMNNSPLQKEMLEHHAKESTKQ